MAAVGVVAEGARWVVWKVETVVEVAGWVMAALAAVAQVVVVAAGMGTVAVARVERAKEAAGRGKDWVGAAGSPAAVAAVRRAQVAAVVAARAVAVRPAVVTKEQVTVEGLQQGRVTGVGMPWDWEHSVGWEMSVGLVGQGKGVVGGP